jgi:hypothetical protein
LQRHLPASVFVLYGYDAVNDTIVALYTAGDRTGEVDGTPIPLGDRLSGWVAATAQTVMNSDARLDLADLAWEHSPLRSALAVPIISNGRLDAASVPDGSGWPAALYRRPSTQSRFRRELWRDEHLHTLSESHQKSQHPCRSLSCATR